jgi:hypothetical protein
MVGSLFGHLFLRLVYTEPPDVRVMTFLADGAAPAEMDPFYPLEGLTGGLETHLSERSWLDTLRAYSVEEGWTKRQGRGEDVKEDILSAIFTEYMMLLRRRNVLCLPYRQSPSLTPSRRARPSSPWTATTSGVTKTTGR